MTANEIATILSAKRGGSFFTVQTARPAKVRKGVEAVIVKTSVMQGMIADYANRKAVREAIEAGDRDAPEMPSWAEAVEIGGVRFWRNLKSGAHYLPVVLSGNKARSEWTMDGQAVSVDDIRELLLASETAPKPSKDDLADKGQVPFIAVGVDNITAIH